MFCNKCGTEVLESDKFCKKCGQGLKEESSAGILDLNKNKIDILKNNKKKAIISLVIIILPIIGYLFYTSTKDFSYYKKSKSVIEKVCSHNSVKKYYNVKFPLTITKPFTYEILEAGDTTYITINSFFYENDKKVPYTLMWDYKKGTNEEGILVTKINDEILTPSDMAE